MPLSRDIEAQINSQPMLLYERGTPNYPSGVSALGMSRHEAMIYLISGILEVDRQLQETYGVRLPIRFASCDRPARIIPLDYIKYAADMLAGERNSL